MIKYGYIALAQFPKSEKMRCKLAEEYSGQQKGQ